MWGLYGESRATDECEAFGGWARTECKAFGGWARTECEVACELHFSRMW